MKERHRRAKEVFLAALELDGVEQRAFLERACGRDRGLRVEVESLLAHGETDTREFGSVLREATELGEIALRERFRPGSRVDERYTIVRRLGAGGMGEVYLAEDERLGERVALKFLPPALAELPSHLARLLAEARHARGITHPNVCRVHDVGDLEGELFISMEYIEGEDLSAYLHRVGRIPPAVVRRMARELCAALAAAHQVRVLHRDLKPSNVLVDREGGLHVADFGLAVQLHEGAGPGFEAGSPAYMAPELLAGQAPTVQSDLFALGLVLFELVGRRRAYASPGAIRSAARSHAAPPDPGPDADPVVARIVRRCLEPDPAARPDSAERLERALAEEDPLRAVLTLGEVASPELVAQSGTRGLLGAGTALWLFGLFLGLLAVFVPLAAQVMPVQRAGPELPPAAFAGHAHEWLSELVPGRPDASRAFGYAGADVLEPLEWDGRRWRIWRGAASSGGLGFWYREGVDGLAPQNASTLFYRQGRTQPADPPLDRRGTITLQLDPDEHLQFFSRVPEEGAEPSPADQVFRWAPWFVLAGLARQDFGTPVGSRLPIPGIADRRFAWEGPAPGDPGVQLRVEAGLLGTEPVFFAVFESEPTEGGWYVEERDELSGRIFDAVLLVLIGFAVVMGWYHLRTGRGDPWGALRLAVFTFAMRFAAWVLRAGHVGDVTEETTLLIVGLAAGLFDAFLAWGCYMGVEPLVRRTRPRLLVSWTRVLQGRFHDRLVVSHVLLGSVVGAVLALLTALDAALVAWRGVVPEAPVPSYALRALSGPASWVSILPSEAVAALTNALYLLTLFVVLLALLVVLRTLLITLRALLDMLGARPHRSALTLRSALMRRSPLNRFSPLAVALSVAIIATVDVLPAADPAVAWLTIGLGHVLLGYLVLIRYGVLPYAVALFVQYVLEDFPATTDLSVWYGSSTVFAVATVVILAGGAAFTLLRPAVARA